MQIIGVSFKDNGKIYNFIPNSELLEIGDYVIVSTEKGEQFGKVIKIEAKEINRNLKSIIRKSDSKDYEKYLKNLKDAKNALIEAKEIINQLGLEMQLIDCSYTFDRKQLLFNFIADERIDFRELVKLLASKYKTRIELHQIGVRDKAKEIGGIGQCGRQLCCATHLNQMDSVTMNMAKNQNLALNPAKINGSCGRLLCCLAYEDEIYTEARKILPNIGDKLQYKNKRWVVHSIDLLKKRYVLEQNGEFEEINIE